MSQLVGWLEVLVTSTAFYVVLLVFVGTAFSFFAQRLRDDQLANHSGNGFRDRMARYSANHPIYVPAMRWVGGLLLAGGLLLLIGQLADWLLR